VTSPFPGYTPHVSAKPKTLSRQKYFAWMLKIKVKYLLSDVSPHNEVIEVYFALT
jgi:hypothetical protein